MEEFFIDEETGECVVLSPSSDPANRRDGVNNAPVNDAETGEPELGVSERARPRRIPFQIPKQVKEELSSASSSSSSSSSSPSKNNGRRRRDKRFIDVEPVSGTSFAQTNPVVLFLLAILYFRWILALVMILELAFHTWTHHKNKSLKNANVFFRSPFHGVTSEFCALCQNENCMDRVGKIQDQRMHKFLRQCNYVKRAAAVT